MKKLHLKGTALVIMLLHMITPVWADEITEIKTAITDLSGLTPGTKVMFFHQHADGTSRHYYLSDNEGSIGQRANIPTINEAESAKFAWTVLTVKEDEKTFYKFKSNITGKYINFRSGEDAKILKEVGAKFSIESAGDNQNDHWKIKDTETTNTYCWFNGNSMQNGGFTTYDGGSPYEIIPVTTNTTDESIITIIKKDIYGNTLVTTTDIAQNGTEYTININEEDAKTYNLKVNGNPTNENKIIISGSTTIEYTYLYTPFESSNIQGNSFPEDTKWYLLGINAKGEWNTPGYLKYENNQDHISITDNTDYSDAYWWAFNIKEDGTIEIFNKLAGADKKLSSPSPKNDNNDGGNTKPIMRSDAELAEGIIAAWDISKSSLIENKKGFFLDRAGIETYKMNDRQRILAFWNSDKGIGSTFWLVDVNEAGNQIKSNIIKFENVVGAGYSSDIVREIEEMPTNTPEDIIALKETVDQTSNVSFDYNKYYRIWGAIEQQYIYIANDQKLYTQAEKGGINQIFKFDATNEEGVYNLKIQGENIAKTTSNGNLDLLFTTAEENVNNGTFKLIDANTGVGKFRIQNMNGDANPTYIWKEYQKVVGWSGTGNGSQWYLVEVPSIDVVITEAGYATANYPFAVQLPADGSLKAYTGEIQEGTDGKVLLLTEVPEGKIPAETPVVLEGAQGNYTLTIDSENTEPSISSALAGTLLPKTIEENTTVYGLGYVNAAIGFYKMSDTDRTIGANKAYLPSSPVLQGVRGVTFSFGDNSGETTGIEDVTSNLAEEEYYDLLGRRVMNPTKGIYVTKSGKKVLFTK